MNLQDAQNAGYISTHTLTWSVTLENKRMVFYPQHFNSHAHVERDNEPTGRTKRRLYFNSHAHVERDMNLQDAQNAGYISTHTLTWSVTENGGLST